MNMLKFAALVSWLTARSNNDVLDVHDAETLQHHIEGLMPEVGAVSCADIDALLSSMQQVDNGKKIEAIKAYRALTKAGLKESKDAVERYAPSVPNDLREGKPEYRCDLLEIQRNSNDDIRLRVRLHEANRHFGAGEIVITSAVNTINFNKGYAVTKNSVYRWF